MELRTPRIKLVSFFMAKCYRSRVIVLYLSGGKGVYRVYIFSGFLNLSGTNRFSGGTVYCATTKATVSSGHLGYLVNPLLEIQSESSEV